MKYFLYLVVILSLFTQSPTSRAQTPKDLRQYVLLRYNVKIFVGDRIITKQKLNRFLEQFIKEAQEMSLKRAPVLIRLGIFSHLSYAKKYHAGMALVNVDINEPHEALSIIHDNSDFMREHNNIIKLMNSIILNFHHRFTDSIGNRKFLIFLKAFSKEFYDRQISGKGDIILQVIDQPNNYSSQKTSADYPNIIEKGDIWKLKMDMVLVGYKSHKEFADFLIKKYKFREN